MTRSVGKQTKGMNRMDTQEMERRRVLRRGFLDKLAEELSGSPYYAACRERTAALAAQFGTRLGREQHRKGRPDDQSAHERNNDNSCVFHGC